MGSSSLSCGLDAVDDVERVLALAHDDNARHDVAGAVEVGDPAAQVGAERHVADIADAYGDAVSVAREDDLADIGGRLRVAPPTNHVLSACHLDKPSTHIVVARADGLEHLADGNVERPQAIRVDLDLVLAHEAAEWRHLGDAGHGLQVVLQVPILIAAQLIQTLPARRVDQRVLKHPPHTGRVWPQFRAYALR